MWIFNKELGKIGMFIQLHILQILKRIFRILTKMTYKLFLIIIAVWFLVFEKLVFGMSLRSLELLISCFVVLVLRKQYSHFALTFPMILVFCISLSDWILIITFSRCYHQISKLIFCFITEPQWWNLFVIPT